MSTRVGKVAHRDPDANQFFAILEKKISSTDKGDYTR